MANPRGRMQMSCYLSCNLACLCKKDREREGRGCVVDLIDPIKELFGL